MTESNATTETTPAATAPDPNEVLPGGLTRAQLEQAQLSNPFFASAYIATHGLGKVAPAAGTHPDDLGLNPRARARALSRLR